MTDERLLEIEQHARRYEKVYEWVGASGTMAMMLIELVNEVRRMRKAQTCSECGDLLNHLSVGLCAHCYCKIQQ